MPLLSPVLQLGDFIFEGFEEPYQLNFGKEQATGTHILIGGGKIIDMLGATDPDITWSGYFTGFQAEYRARFMEGLCKAGQPLLLKTSQFIKQVVIKKFTYGFHFKWPIQYTITVQVVQDQTLPVNFQIPGDLTQTILEYLFQAEDIAALINNPSISSELALAVIAAQAAAPFDGASNTLINGALSAAQNAVSAVNTVIKTTEQGLFG